MAADIRLQNSKAMLRVNTALWRAVAVEDVPTAWADEPEV